VAVLFDQRVADLIREVHWSPLEQKEARPDGGLLYKVEVSSLREFMWWILGYGAHARVVEPPALRRMVKAELARMSHLYQT
jgi:predicted DNA-binding transcriptional regulator YafY